MNDFTKDELQELHFFTTLHKDRYGVKHADMLLNKIQSMIESYCEHHYVLRCHDNVIYCPKCGKEQI